MTRKKLLSMALLAVTMCFCACGEKTTEGSTSNAATAVSEKLLAEDKSAPQDLTEAATNWKNNSIETYKTNYPYPYFNVKYEIREMDIDGDGEGEYQVCIRLWGDATTIYEDYVILDSTASGVEAVDTENFYFFSGYKLASGKYANKESFSDGYIAYLYHFDEKDGFVEEEFLDYYVDNDVAEYTYGNCITDETKTITEDEFNAKFDELFEQEGSEEYTSYEVISTEEYEYKLGEESK